MSTRCPECGAPVPASGDCRKNLHAMLFLEAEIPGGPGNLAHFYAVASYGLQHPKSMGYTAETLQGLRSAVEAVLAGDSTLAEVRRSVRARASRAGRVTRRGSEPVPGWPVSSWPITVADVLDGGADSYRERVERWARSITTTLTGLHVRTDL